MATAPKSVPKAVPKGDAAAGDAAAPAKSKKKLILIVLILLLVLGGGGAGAWFFLGHGDAEGKKSAEAHKKEEPAKPPVFVVMEPFVVNLQSEGVEQFLQIAFTIQVADQATVELMKLYMPQIRSRILLLLSGKKATEISSVDGKKALADEITALVKQPFSPGAAPQGVNNVFFTSFVIQ